MTPAPRKPCFRHEPEDASCYGAVQWKKPIPTDPNGRGDTRAVVAADRSITGDSHGTVSSKQQPICDRIEKSLLPLKKRAASHDGSSADDSLVISPKKRRADTGRSDGAMSYGIPVQSHRAVTVRTRVASPRPSSSNAITIVTSQQPPPQQQKLMHDVIRSGGVTTWHALAACSGSTEQAETSAAGAARAKKNTNRNRNKRLRPAPRDHRPLPAELSRHVVEVLGATAPPHFVRMKTLQKSDVDRNQNRLLFSCKPEFLDDHPITALFAGNEKETYFVHELEAGLHVSAIDGDYRVYDIRIRYLDSNGGYRLIGSWSTFVEANGLGEAVEKGRRVDVEVWAFRSPRLPGQPVLTKKDKHKQRVVDALEESHHPDGALGLLFLPYVDDAEDVHLAEEEWEPAPPPLHEMTKRQASAKAARQEKKLAADHGRANRGKAVEREMTLDEVITRAGQEVADALIGLLMLSSCRSSPVPVLNYA